MELNNSSSKMDIYSDKKERSQKPNFIPKNKKKDKLSPKSKRK